MYYIDYMWVIVCACFVFFMQAGFLCYEVGFVQAKNVVSVAVENIQTFVITTLIFCIWGFGLMFGPTYHGLWGNGYWLLGHLQEAASPLHDAYVFFQLMFAGTAVTIFSGSMSERTKLSALIWAAFCLAGLIYPLYGHWVWGGIYSGGSAWLQQLGFIDFAGATVVHATAGWFALAGTIMVGARNGRFDANGQIYRLGRSNIPFAALGTFILWFSWFGFNGGSLLKFDVNVGLILLNTNFAAAAGVAGALLTTWLFIKDHSYMEAIFSGALGGLVAITAGSNLLAPVSSIVVGFIAGAVVVSGALCLERWRIDDAVGAVAIHAFGGATGTVLLALLMPAESLAVGARAWQLAVQLLGVIINFAWAFGLGLGVFYLLKRVSGLRVTPEEEKMGLNIVEFNDIYSWADFLKTSSYENLADTLNSKIHEQNIMLKKQSQLLIATQEQERLKIGRDLHDGVGQALAAAKLQLGMLKNRLDGEEDPGLGQNVSRTLSLVDAAIGEMRNVLMNLRPTMLKEKGLQDSIQNLVTNLKLTNGLDVELIVQDPLPFGDEAVDLNIYRIVQESLTNIMRHADASKVEILLGKLSEEVYGISIADNGQGFLFTAETAGIGLTSMQERAAMLGGRLRITSTPGLGTQVVLEVPLEKN